MSDIKDAEREVHVLTPTRYEAPVGNVDANVRIFERNEKLGGFAGVVGYKDCGWRQMHVDVLRLLGQERGRI